MHKALADQGRRSCATGVPENMSRQQHQTSPRFFLKASCLLQAHMSFCPRRLTYYTGQFLNCQAISEVRPHTERLHLQVSNREYSRIRHYETRRSKMQAPRKGPEGREQPPKSVRTPPPHQSDPPRMLGRESSPKFRFCLQVQRIHEAIAKPTEGA